jgi:hypothetical protein
LLWRGFICRCEALHLTIKHCQKNEDGEDLHLPPSRHHATSISSVSSCASRGDLTFALAQGWWMDWVQDNFNVASLIAPGKPWIPFRTGTGTPVISHFVSSIKSTVGAPSQKRPTTCKSKGEIVFLATIPHKKDHHSRSLLHRQARQASDRSTDRSSVRTSLSAL